MTDQITAAPHDGVERIWRGVRKEQDTLLGTAAGQDQTDTATYRLPVAPGRAGDDLVAAAAAPPEDTAAVLSAGPFTVLSEAATLMTCGLEPSSP